jgi:hypothetical protein
VSWCVHCRMETLRNSPLLPWGQEPTDTRFVVRYRMGLQEYDRETALYHAIRAFPPTGATS